VSALDLAIDSLAVYRLTRLVTRDRVLRSARARWIKASYGVDIDRRLREHREKNGTLDDKTDVPKWAAETYDWMEATADHEWDQVVDGDDGAPMLAYLARCPWCVSIYVGLGVTIARLVAPRAWSLIARALAASAVAGLVQTNDGGH
jgi:hypothetical protein